MEKLSPKESVEDANTVLRGSVRAPEGFSEGKPEAAKPRGRSPRGFAAEGFPEENPECEHPLHSPYAKPGDENESGLLSCRTCAVKYHLIKSESPNLPYSEGIGSPEAAAGAPFKSTVTVHFLHRHI